MSQANPTKTQTNSYAENWVLYGDQTRAWRVAFPESKANKKVSWEKASVFHKKKKVQKRIAELQEILKTQSEEEFSFSVKELKQKLLSAINKGLKDKTDQQGNKVAVSISGAVSAINEINKMDGNHKPFQLEVTDGDVTPWSSIKAGVDE